MYLNKPSNCAICGAQSADTTMITNIETRPYLRTSASLRLGLDGLMKSRVMSADALLRVESMLLMIAAMRPARTSPMTPTGSSEVTMCGNTLSAASAMPGLS